MIWLILTFLLAAIPLGVLAWFITSLALYLHSRKKDGTVPFYQKVMLIVSSSLLGCVIISVILLVAVFSLAIAHM